jgi:hypothetical protein
MEIQAALSNPVVKQLLSDPAKLANLTERLQQMINAGPGQGSLPGTMPTLPVRPVTVNFKLTPEAAIKAIASNLLGIGDWVVLVWGGAGENIVISLAERNSVHGSTDGDKFYDPQKFFTQLFQLVLRQNPDASYWKRAIIDSQQAMSAIAVVINDRQGVQQLISSTVAS